MKSRLFLSALFLLFTILVAGSGLAQDDGRRHIGIADIPGYHTLKCDFHMHTVFSDGTVWPTVRAQEVWLEGLDAFAITDHIEGKGSKAEVMKSGNRAFEIASPMAERLGLIIIKGAEITKSMPPGHFNAIFLNDADPLDVSDWRGAIRAAADQSAFIMWNHPGWIGQQPDGVARWYPEHTEILQNGWMHGIEIVNEYDYYPEAHRWAIDKKLTLFGNSDVHSPIHMAHDLDRGGHRPMTLVFAKTRDVAGIREALFDRRTAVYKDDVLYGDERFLKPVLQAAIKILNPEVRPVRNQRFWVQIDNSGDIPFALSILQAPSWLAAPKKTTLPANRTAVLEFRAIDEPPAGPAAFILEYEVQNLVTEPGKGLVLALPMKIASE